MLHKFLRNERLPAYLSPAVTRRFFSGTESCDDVATGRPSLERPLTRGLT